MSQVHAPAPCFAIPLAPLGDDVANRWALGHYSMKTNHDIRIYGLDEFGLDIKKLAALGTLPVSVRIHFKYINEAKLFPLLPAERKQRIEAWYEKVYSEVIRKLPTKVFEPLKPAKKKESPRGISATIEAKKFSSLLKVPNISSIFIEKIPGYKRKKPAKAKTNQWFAVQARFAIQIEGQTKGMQTYEDRILLVKAISANNAEKKLLREFKAYSKSYLNSDGYMVRWVFEKVLDTYHLFDDEILDEGTEVFSVLKSRKMKPEYQWLPKGASSD